MFSAKINNNYIQFIDPEFIHEDGRGLLAQISSNRKWSQVNYIKSDIGAIRGNHYHPEFDEYFLITEGEGVLVTRESDESKEDFIFLSKGQCTHTPKGEKHVFIAITDCTAIAMLTKKWDDCKNPIIHVDMGMGKGDHGDPSSPYFKSKKT